MTAPRLGYVLRDGDGRTPEAGEARALVHYDPGSSVWSVRVEVPTPSGLDVFPLDVLGDPPGRTGPPHELRDLARRLLLGSQILADGQARTVTVCPG